MSAIRVIRAVRLRNVENQRGGDRDEERENVNVVVIGDSHFSVPTAEGLQAAAF
jgi:hypothetical protein